MATMTVEGLLATITALTEGRAAANALQLASLLLKRPPIGSRVA
jgi:hypothetical protein